MKESLKAEFRKFLTVRSTYFVSLAVILLTGFLSIYVFGVQESKNSLSNPQFLAQPMSASLGVFVTFAAILAILLVAHEYRYNTISYTLTATTGRLKIVAAKSLVMISYALVMGALVVGIGYFGTLFGIQLTGAELVPQQIDWVEKLWQFVAYSSGYALAGLFIAFIIRSLVGALVFFFVFPILGQLSMLLIKDNVKYLPFHSLDAILGTPAPGAEGATLSPSSAVLLAGLYIAAAIAAASILFVRRDAN